MIVTAISCEQCDSNWKVRSNDGADRFNDLMEAIEFLMENDYSIKSSVNVSREIIPQFQRNSSTFEDSHR